MSSSRWKSWKLNELSAKSVQEELSNTSEIRAQLNQSVAEFEERVRLFERDKLELLASAKEESVAVGKKEGFSLGFEEGYKSGESQAIEKYQKDLSVKLSNAQKITDSLDEFISLLKSTIPTYLTKILKTALQKLLLERETNLANYLIDFISEEIEKIDTIYNEIRLKVSLDDYEEVESHFSTIFETKGWKIVKDPDLSSGGFIIESNDFDIDGSVEGRLAKVFELVDQLGEKQNAE